MQRGGEQRALRAAGGDLVALHRRHHRLRAEQAEALDLRCIAFHGQTQCLQVERCIGRQPALLPARCLRIARKFVPAALRVLCLQACSAVHVGPVHRQPGAGLRTGQGDVERMHAGFARGDGHRAAALPQRSGLGGIQTGHPCSKCSVERLHLEDGYAPVGGALRAGQAQIASLARREIQGLDAAQRIGHDISRLPLLAIERGLQRIAFGVGDIPGEAGTGQHCRFAEIDLEPMAGTERATGHRLRIVVDQVADRHRRNLLR
ncbi:hypothetical protein D3C71_958860 [compost metagenome]